jgi:lantibiotic modifying enzyme
MLRSEIEVSLRTTLGQGFGGNDCMCHGDLGNIEVVFAVSEVLQDQELRARVYRIAGDILERQFQQGWVCGVPAGTETPGLMAGLSGIGYSCCGWRFPTRSRAYWL